MSEPEMTPHAGCAEIEAWLNAKGYPVEENGMFDEQTRDAMRSALLDRIGWDSHGQRHQMVMKKMAEAMAAA